MRRLIFSIIQAHGLILGKDSISSSLQRILLVMLLFVCLIVRILIIQAPALDRTYWKEIDYISISNNYWKHGFDFLQPEITWPAEPPRITAMELPVVPFAAGLLYAVFGFNTYSVRVIPLLAFLLLSLYVFRLVKRELGPLVGLLAALACSIMPLYNPYGRILFSEPPMIAMSVIAIFHFAQWTDFQRKRDWIAAMLGFTLAVSLKPDTLYLTLPFLWLVFRRAGWKIREYRSLLALVVCSLILPLVWYSYAFYLTKISIDVFGIFGGHNKFQTISMLSNPVWYLTMFNRIYWGILGGKVGLILCLVGMITVAVIRRGGLFWSYVVAIGCFFAIVAEGQIDAPYRQLTAIPPLSVFVAFGAITVVFVARSVLFFCRKYLLLEKRNIEILLAGCFLLISLIAVRNYGEIFERDPSLPASSDKWRFAEEIKTYVRKNSKLVTVGEYSIHVGGNDLSPVLYYYSGLQGWTLEGHKGQWNLGYVRNLIDKDASLFAAVHISREPDALPFLNEMKANYKVLYEGEDQFLLDLRRPTSR